MRFSSTLIWAAAAVGSVRGYWMEHVHHLGKSPYHPDPNYKVFRNVKDYGAKGDGVTDDTAAINLAISSGGRCAPQECKGETTSPAVVYLPPGTYIISSSIVDYFYTQIIGDPTNRPVIKATSDFPVSSTFGLIDGNRYGADGLAWKAVNVFFRQIHNLIIDTTSIPASAAAVGIHWPSAQATSLTNVEFRLSQASGTQHTGLFIEEGSGGLLNDLVFRGGAVGAKLGNQQYTARNLQFYGCGTAISQLWDWGWTYKSLVVQDCGVGIEMVDSNTASMVVLDSTFRRVDYAVKTIRRGANTDPKAAGSLVMENVAFDKVRYILTNPDGVVMYGDRRRNTLIAGFVDGHVYDYTGPDLHTDANSPYFPRPAALISGSKYYEKSKPRYENVATSEFISARHLGAKGDGSTDDTAALNTLLAYVASTGKIAFVDAGVYIVTDTVVIPPGARVIGEGLASVIMGSGARFSNMNSPRAVIKVGNPGQTGYVEWSDMIVSTRGGTAGAKLVEWNLATSGEPSGMWDVHVRVGGFAGTNLQLSQCPTFANSSNVVQPECIAAHTSMHITSSGTGLFQENCWLWVADHDLEDPLYRQITIFAGRGLLVESSSGRIWLSASGSEHHVMYQYQLLGTKNIYMGQIQTETPYFQPNPPANIPFPLDSSIRDPDFVSDCNGLEGGPPCEMAWGLRVLGSHNIVIFGVGLYSFFNNYSDACCQPTSGTECQDRIFDIRDLSARHRVSGLDAYNLNTVGTVRMITRYGTDVALAKDNTAGFVDTVAVYHH